MFLNLRGSLTSQPCWSVSEECWTRKECAGRGPAMLWSQGNCRSGVMEQEQSTRVGSLEWPYQGQSEYVGCCKKSLYCTFSLHSILAPKLTWFFLILRDFFIGYRSQTWILQTRVLTSFDHSVCGLCGYSRQGRWHTESFCPTANLES